MNRSKSPKTTALILAAIITEELARLYDYKNKDFNDIHLIFMKKLKKVLKKRSLGYIWYEVSKYDDRIKKIKSELWK